MADPVASVERIVKVGLKIKEAVDTARRNEVVCQEIGRRVLRFSAILSQLQRAGAMDEGSPATSGALGDLEETLQRALELVAACQERRGAVHRLLAARGLARQLREVKDDILNKVMLASFAINAHTTILMLTMHTGGYLLPRLLHQEDTQVVEVSQSSHSTDSTAIANLREFMPSKLWAATINYSDGNIIGRGGSCTVYKGILEDGNAVAVKIFHGPNLGRKHTYDQLVLASKLQHKNIAKVLGYAEGRIGIEEQEYIWIEEYMPKGTLRNFIYEQVLDYAGPRQLDYWLALMRTINGIAQGVHYLHGQHVVHLDLKPDNILFDSYMNPVITDFELSKVLDETEITSEHNKIAGTFPYIAPEHTADGIISTKSDVYAFGITLLEAIGGLRRRSEFPLHRWGWAAWEAGLIEEEFDPAVFIKGSHQLEKIKRYIEVGLLCAQQDRADRPTMADVLEMLEGEKKLPTPKKPAYADPYDKSWIPGGFTSISANALHLSCQERALLRSSVWSEGSLGPSSWSEGSLSPSSWSEGSLSPR